MACVNTSLQEFKKLVSDYNVESGIMELAIKTYMDNYNLDSYDSNSPKFLEYLDTYFKIKSNNIYASKTEFNTALTVYDYYSKLEPSSLEEARQIYNKVVEVFGDTNVILYKTNDGRFKVRVAEPLYSSDNSHFTKKELEILKNVPRDAEGYLLAPNGKRSNLTGKQYAQVRTKAFKDWFGDWENDPTNASKVVDENGEPLVVYTGRGKNEFEFKSRLKGFYATASKYIADTYAKNYNGATYEIFLNIKNPYKINDSTRIKLLNGKEQYAYRKWQMLWDDKDVEGFLGEHDGGIYNGGSEYLVINSNQIKSATDNIGTFSKENDRIDKFTEQLNETLDYLKSTEESINTTFNGSNLSEVLNSFREELNKIIKTNQELNHYDLGETIKPNDKLENIKDAEAYSQYIQTLISSIIKKLESQGKSIEIKASNINSAMAINSSGNTIKLYYNPNLLLSDFSRFDYILAHELVHSVTSNAINNSFNETATKEEKQFTDEVWEIIKDLYNNKQFHWDFGFDLNKNEDRASHIKEFIANVMTNPNLQSRLTQIKTEDNKQSLWSKFVSAIKNLLNKYLGIDTKGSYLEKLMNTVSSYIENQTTNIERYNNSIVDKFTENDNNFYHEHETMSMDFTIDSRLSELFNLQQKEGYVSLKKVVDLLSDSEYSGIIELLKTKKDGRKLLLSDISIRFDDSNRDGRFDKSRAFYDAENKTIHIFTLGHYKNGRVDSVLLHEILHAITVNRIIANKEYRAEFDKIIDEYLKHFYNNRYSKTSFNKKYAAHYMEEFIADIWSNPETIENLKKIKSNSKLTLWDRIKQFFIKIFKGSEGTLMADASDAIYRLLDQPELGWSGDIYREGEDITQSNQTTQLTTIFEEEIKQLSKEDKQLLEDELGGINTPTQEEFKQDEIDKQRSGLYNNPLLSASERTFLANNVMYLTSFIVSQLQSSKEANSYYFGNKFDNVDLTKLSREEIIDIVGINTIFDYIREKYYNPDNRSDIDFDTADKLQVAYDNWGALCKSAYCKLIFLEGVTVVKSRPEDIALEDLEKEFQENLDSDALAEKEREYWQMGIRNIPAKASLSGDIKRAFEKLFVIDKNGNPVKDEFGFGFDTFVDSGIAINSILEWVNNATTIVEMENILKEYSVSYPWVNSILEKIKEEPFRSQFFQNFRKDFTQYSIITVGRDKKTGLPIYTNTVINTKGATQAILDEVVSFYNMGLMKDIIITTDGVEGKGRVNIQEVTNLDNSIKNTIINIQKAISQNNRIVYNKTIKESLPIITDILKKFGVRVDENIVKAVINQPNPSNPKKSRAIQLLTELSYMTTILLEHTDNTTYNPIEKGTFEGNIYSNYKNLINILGKYIQNSIESSTYENGKMHYSFVTPSYMGKLVLNLKNSLEDYNKFNQFMEENYASYRWFKDGNTWNNTWLELINSSEIYRNALEHKVQLSFNKDTYTELGEVSYLTSILQEYFYDTKGKWAWYRIPILSNKPSSEFLKFKRYSGLNYKRDIKKGLAKVVNQELMRIKTVLDRAVNPNVEKIGVKEKTSFDISDKLLKKYPDLKEKLTPDKEGKLHLTHSDLVREGRLITSDSGASFKFIDYLNNDIIDNTELGQLIILKINGEEIDENRFSMLLYDRFDNGMKAVVENELSEYERMGLFNITESKKGKQSNYAYIHIPNLSRDAVTIAKNDLHLSDKELSDIDKYMDKIEDIMHKEAVEKLEEFIWNDVFADINIIQLTATDLAYYRNIEDFQKRYAQVHSPSLRFNVYAEDTKGVRYSADGKERTLYLKDSIEKSDIILNVKQVFDSKIEQITNSNEKSDMIKMRDLILSSFEEINFADAQGYSSPTSYRKKQGMAGRWNDNMEEAYNRIKSGNFNVNDLGVVWQPMKPFVYSQIRKPSGSQIMTDLKVPVQNKNSEYLLILADALMRGGNKVNKLSAIYDFMEDSSYDGRISEFDEKTNTYKVIQEGTYNGTGIDTVQFISAVNSGAMGAVDITKAQSYSEVKDILNRFAYINSEKLPIKENNNDRYNVQYVHTIPFEDYGIQQEIPAHFVDHEQLMGSQLRILSISDIRKDTMFKVGNDKNLISNEQLITEYQTLIAENINESFDELCKEFKVTGSRLEKNKAIERILQDAIEKDQKYGNDLQRACSLNENGEFIIPLSDPIQSVRVQQLINSIIKSRINKQKVKGGPVVQASSFGMSDELNIIFQDKNGNLLDTFTEFCKKNNLEKTSQEAEDKYSSYLKENQSSVHHFEVYAPIPSKELEEALTRYDEKGNAYIISMEEAIKEGIIPEEMRKGIGYRIPTEDKYSMAPIYIKGFLPRAAGDAIMLPKEITLLSGSDFDIDKMYIFLKAFVYDNNIDAKKLLDDIMKSSKATGKERQERVEEIKMIIEQIQSGMKFSVGSKEEKIYQYYIKNKNRYTKGFKLATDKRSKRDNRIFDIQWSVLTNEDTAIKMFNPGSFDEQKKTSRIIRVLEETNTRYTYEQLDKLSISDLDAILEKSTIKRNIVYPSTQIYFHKQNMTAGKMIGIFANNNTSHAFLSLQDIRLDLEDDEAFTFNGVKIDKNQNNKIDAQLGHNGKFISKTIAGFLAASVDAVKDPVLNFMNLNTFTSGPAMLLARLGFDSDSIGLLLSQPIIKELASEYIIRNNNSYISTDDIIDEYLQRYLKDKDTIDNYRKSISNTQFSKKELVNGISNKVKNSDFQKRVLVLFERLLNISNELNTITFLTKFNSSTNAVGPTIADTIVMEDRYQRFLNNVNSGNTYFTPNVANVINNSPILKAFYEKEMSASKLIFEPYFPHYSKSFNEVLGLLRSITKTNLDSKTINLLINDYMYYCMTQGDSPVVDSSYDNRKKMILNFVQRFNRAKESLTDNELLKTIYIKSQTNKCKIPTLESKTGGYTQDIQEKIRNSWTELFSKDKTRQFGKDLFIYNLFRNGFSYNPKGFLHLSSVDVKLAIDGYVNALNDITNNIEINPYDFILQFMRNHSDSSKIVPDINSYSSIIEETYSQQEGNKITIRFSSPSDVSRIALSTIEGTTEFSPMVIYKNSIYYAKNTSGIDNITYYKTEPLGVQNNFLEYDANVSAINMRSVINENLREDTTEEEDINTPSKEEPIPVGEQKKPSGKLTQEEKNFILNEVLSEVERQDLKLMDNENKKKMLREVLNEYKSYEQSMSIQNMIDEILKKLC